MSFPWIRRCLKGLFLVCALVTMPAIAAPVLLISVDGLRPDDVLYARERGLHLPHLTRFLREGSYAQGVKGVLPTLTYPSHVTLLTGVSPARHGVGGNLTFDPHNKNQYGWYWYASDIKVQTLWEAAHAAGLSTANVHWPVSVAAAGVDWNLPQIWRAGTADDRKLLAALSTSGLLAALEPALGAYPLGISEELDDDRQRARFATAILERYRPDFMTVYLASLDHAEHAHGPGAPEANRVLEQIDAVIGELVEAAQKVHPDGVIAIVSDHGFTPIQQDVNLYAPFLEAGLITQRDGAIVDWLATPWNDGGSAAIVLRDPQDPALQERVRTLLEKIKSNPAYAIAEVLDRTQIAQRGGAVEASWFVVFKPGYEMGIRPDAPLQVPGRYRGMHGYDPARADQLATLLLAGKGVPAGRSLGVVDMRAIAPTLAGFLGVSLPQAQARSVFAADLSTQR